MSRPEAGRVVILVYGTNGQPYRLLTSTTLTNWVPAATNQVGADGTLLFEHHVGSAEPGRFYRVVSP